MPFTPDPKPIPRPKKQPKPLKRSPIKKNTSYRIPKVGRQRKKEQPIYSKDRKIFLEGKICFIDGCNKPADTVEHTRGRVGSMYLNQEFWKPCCWDHNTELESNPELSKEYQLSKLHGGKK